MDIGKGLSDGVSAAAEETPVFAPHPHNSQEVCAHEGSNFPKQIESIGVCLLPRYLLEKIIFISSHQRLFST